MSIDLNSIQMTKNYSASDIEIVCKEAKMNYVRQVIKAIECKSSGKIY